MTLVGNLFFGKNVSKFLPSFYIDCAYFDEDDISTQNFVSKAKFSGAFVRIFNESLSFLKSNFKHIQVKSDFNPQAKLEIDERIFVELIINALIHRDYYMQSSIKIFIFYHRVEIISPGKLTNSLTVEKIKVEFIYIGTQF